MLSLTKGKKIAIIDGDKNDAIYLTDEKIEPDMDTTDENKRRIFLQFIELDKKLSSRDIDEIMEKYDGKDIELKPRLDRKHYDSMKNLEMSLKKEFHLSVENTLTPIIEESSYRIFVSGLSGSGKSYYISEFLKFNKPKAKGAGIFLFSPVHNDKAMESIKNLIHIDLDWFADEFERELEIDDIPDGSIVIFDDVESFNPVKKKTYLALRDIFLERGRHKNISTITVSHNAMNGNTTKASIRESQYWILFPKFNSRDTKNILITYGGLNNNEIDKIMKMKTRGLMYKKTVPKYCVGQHDIIAFD